MSQALVNETETPELSPETTMGNVMRAFPGARRALFARYHIGGCSSCGFGDSETLAEVCRRNDDPPIAEVIAHIHRSHEEDRKFLIEPADLAHALAGAEKPRLLDARTREEFDAVKLPEAELFGQETIQRIFGAWPKDTAIVVYDHTGDRCLDAAAYLAGHGFKNTRALRGGIDAYAAEVDSSLPRYRLEFED